MDSDKAIDQENIINNMIIINNKKDTIQGDWDSALNYYKKMVNCETKGFYTVCDLAAFMGHLKVLKFAQQHGCPWNRTNSRFGFHSGTLVCTYAAAGGHVEVLKYAHENGFPWNEYTCAYAVKNGHTDVLYYLYKNQAPYYMSGEIHENCKVFCDTFGPFWKKCDFTYNHRHIKRAKDVNFPL